MVKNVSFIVHMHLNLCMPYYDLLVNLNFTERGIALLWSNFFFPCPTFLFCLTDLGTVTEIFISIQ